MKINKKIMIPFLSLTLTTPLILNTVSCNNKKEFIKIYNIENSDIDNGEIKKETLEWLKQEKYTGIGNINNLVITKLPSDFWEYFPNKTKIYNEEFRSLGLKSMPKLPSRIRSIGEYAFASNYITSLEFEENSQLTYIGKCAFLKTDIQHINDWPPNLIEIDEEAFAYTKIRKIILPESLKFIRKRAFYSPKSENTNYERIALPVNIKEIELEAFYRGSKAYKMKLSKNCKYAGIEYKGTLDENFILNGLSKITNIDWRKMPLKDDYLSGGIIDEENYKIAVDLWLKWWTPADIKMNGEDVLWGDKGERGSIFGWNNSSVPADSWWT